MIRVMVCFVLALPVGFLSCTSKKEEKQAAPTAVNEYPPLSLKLSDGTQLPARDLKGDNIFVLFQPDCSHCQEEAVHIEQRLTDFRDYTLYFISSAPMDQITGFAREYGLDGKPNVRFAWTAPEGVLTYYGPIPTPSVYIYRDGKLRQSFNGQTEIDNILKAL